MRLASNLLIALAVSVPILTTSFVPSRAENGQVAAGILGGLFAGTILGSALAPRPYYPPQPVYIAPAYAEPSCYLTRGEPVWDGYRWVRPRVEMCD